MKFTTSYCDSAVYPRVSNHVEEVNIWPRDDNNNIYFGDEVKVDKSST